MNRLVFDVSFRCNNCMYDWNSQYPFGSELVGDWQGAYFSSEQCTHLMSCEYCYRIKCANCGSEKVRVTSRTPYNGGD